MKGLVLVIAVVAALLAGGLARRDAEAAPINVTVTILRFIEVDDPDPAPFQGVGDYYARVRIGGFGFQDTFAQHQDDTPDISPFWTFTQTVDDSLGSVPVTIQMRDDDVFPAEPDDDIDLNPIDNVLELNLSVSLSTGTWTGDVPPNVGFSVGDGDTEHAGLFEGGERGRILFDISLGGDGDIDDDGIPDGVERFGVRDTNGNVVADMAALGADPCRKTVAIEVDFMTGPGDGHTHQPLAGAVAEAVAGFNAAPVAAVAGCPYAGFPTQGSGVNLVVDVSNGVPEVAAIDDFGATFDAIKLANFDANRGPYFHYSLWIHNRQGTTSSGVCCEGKDFIVSLGSFTNQVGTVREQSGTFIHELGHDLGLGHGGGDGVNCKPNYLSVMSYVFQVVGISNVNTGVAAIDYSRVDLPDLNEASLAEPNGISDGALLTAWADDVGTTRTGRGDGPLDWDWDTPANATETVGVDVNAVTGAGCGASPNEVLTGFDDWSNIQYRAAMSSTAGGVNTIFNEITLAEASFIQQFWTEALDPDLTADKSVLQADAEPGDTLNYTVDIDNIGTGEAADVTVVDTFPDATSEERDLANLRAGESTSELFEYAIPCATADLTVLVNSATVSGTNLASNPEADTSNNTDTASTTVHTPVLVLGKVATAAVNAGEAITYTITYENTGSADAANVVITDTLPAGVYYSAALDVGAGPLPDTVASNLDGTTTLTWDIGALAAASGPQTIEYAARPTLLFLGGEVLENAAELTFENDNGCVYPALTASAETTVTVTPPTENPKSMGFWRNHEEEWLTEILARIQATDQRYDGRDGSAPDGALTGSEVEAMLAPGGNFPKILEMQLLAVYFNLATRRINAATLIESNTANTLGLSNVADAAFYAMDTLELPVNSTNRPRYSAINRVLDEINNNKSEVY